MRENRDLTKKLRTRLRTKMTNVRSTEKKAKTEEESIEDLANQVDPPRFVMI